MSDLQTQFSEALALQFARDWSAAENSYRNLLSLAPSEPVIRYNLGIVLKAQRRFSEAIQFFREALEMNPRFVEAANNLGTTLATVGELDEAIQILDTCTLQHPTGAEFFNNLGDAYKDRGEIELAVDTLRQAVRLQPESPVFLSNLIYAEHYDPRATPASLLASAKLWDQRFSRNPPAQSPIRSATEKAPRGRRKRIGYIGAFFREHCQSLFLLPLLANHDRKRHEIFCYSDDSQADDITSRLRGHVDRWRDIAGRSAADIAAIVSNDEIDVLIDLGLHTAQNYLAVFALRPATRQISWLGYPGTTGLRAIDARLTDPFLDPPGDRDALYTEHSIRLPHTFWCYSPAALGSSATPPRAPRRVGEVTFGCLNNFCKTNHAVFASWRQILTAVPESRLILMAPLGLARKRVETALGIDSARIRFVEFASRAQYLERYREIDLCLDTYPYNGHTTSLDALWMGVPVITRFGDTAVSRAGFSFLANLNLGDLAAKSEEEFIRIAIELAKNQPRQRELHSTLRGRMENSPLMKAAEFARDFEHALFAEA